MQLISGVSIMTELVNVGGRDSLKSRKALTCPFRFQRGVGFEDRGVYITIHHFKMIDGIPTKRPVSLVFQVCMSFFL